MIYELVPKPFKNAYKKLYWKVYYNFMASYSAKYGAVVYPRQFMNYGYATSDDIGMKLGSETSQELQIKSYLNLMQNAPIDGKAVIEIGCGKGGGCNLFYTHFKPKKIVGVDISKENIVICQKRYKDTSIEFLQGDAEKQIFPNNSFDVVLNLESSHCYPLRIAFFKNVYSILNKDGYFLYVDLFWSTQDTLDIEKQLTETGFKFIKKEDITQNIVLSLELQGDRNKDILKKLKYLKSFGFMKNIIATTDSVTYAGFKNGPIKYMLYVLKKE